MTNGMTTRSKLLDPKQFVTLYGTTPPRADAPSERVTTVATRLAERVSGLALDGLVVYDVQDESERTTTPRPFPFLPTLEPRGYARLLQELTGTAAITYKCVVNMDEAGWLRWLDETRASYELTHLSLVGSSSPVPVPGTLPVDRALQLAAGHEAGFTLGGVLIAERHSPTFSESARLLHKTAQGCSYFVSQVVYSADATVALLADYVEACRRRGEQPRRIVLTFSPCGRPKTMEFIKWLGVAITPETERAILEDPTPFTRSIAICCANLRAVLDHAYVGEIPFGVNIESVSIHKDEIDASIELVHALREVACEYGLGCH